MKLKSIKSISPLYEGRVDPNVLLSIKHLIAKGGKNPDNYQLLILGRILLAIKLGLFYSSQDFYAYETCPGSDLIQTLRLMNSEDILKTALKIDNMLEVKNLDLMNSYIDQVKENDEWIKLFVSRESID